MTKDPSAQVVSMLEQFRDVADEIVVAVDSKVPEDEAQRFAGIADRLVRFEYAPPAERSFAWLFSLCSGEWILRIDGDEVPSSALIRILPDLVRRRDVFHYLLPRRWIYPDSRHWIREDPWWPDFQDRLVRNDPAVLRVRGRVHSSLFLTPPMRYVDAPFYHLDCVLNPFDNRRAKVDVYEALRPRTTIRSANDMYLPETCSRTKPVPVPDEDVGRIARVLGTQVPPDRVDRKIELVPLATVDQHWKLRPIGDHEYGGSVSFWEEPLDIRANESKTVYLAVHNTGTFLWDDRPPAVQVGYRWFTHEGDVIAGAVPQSPLPCRVRPGETAIVPIEVTGPVGGGSHLLEVVLIHDGHRWFGQPGRIAVDVDGNASDDRAEWFRRRVVELERELEDRQSHIAALSRRRSVRWADRVVGFSNGILRR